MPLSSPRADNLALICELVALVGKGVISNTLEYSNLLERKSGWKKSRRYHYLNALRDLGLVEVSKGQMKLTQTGRRLQNIRNTRSSTMLPSDSLLSYQEKQFFRNYLLTYDPFRLFLSLFMKTRFEIKTIRDFVNHSSFVGLVFKRDRSDKKSGRQHLSGWSVFTPAGEERELTFASRGEIMWTLKYWAKELDLIDEIWISQFEQFTGRFSKVLFPIKADLQDLERFEALLKNVIKRRNYNTQYIPIPIILYDFCTHYFTTVHTFLHMLSLLYFRFPEKYYLDKVPRAFIDERMHTIGRKKKREGGFEQKYTNYPVIDSFYSSHLVIR